MPRPERAPIPEDSGPPILDKGGGRHDVSHYRKYLAEQGHGPTNAEEKAITAPPRTETGRAKKIPPPDYRDPSEFEGAGGQLNLKELRQGHEALERAVREAKAKETLLKEEAAPDSPVGRAQEKLRVEKIADKLFNEVTRAVHQELPALLQAKLQEAVATGNGKNFLAAIRESVARLHSIAGTEIGPGGKTIGRRPGMEQMTLKAGVLEKFLVEAPAHIEGDVVASAAPPEALDKLPPPLYRKGDVLASAPPPKETHEAGPPPKPLPGGVRIRGGMGVKIE